MSKVSSISFPDDIYERLIVSSEKMGLSKSGYVTFALKQIFNQEDMMEKMPDMVNQLKEISRKIDQMKE